MNGHRLLQGAAEERLHHVLNRRLAGPAAGLCGPKDVLPATLGVLEVPLFLKNPQLDPGGTIRNQLWQALRRTLDKWQVDRGTTPLWWGEVELARIDDPRLATNPGVLGCGVIVPTSVATSQDGSSGALRWRCGDAV